MNNKKRVVSGVRPTGPLHLGNFHGVLLNWVSMQNNYDCYFFIADWHALTTDYNKTDFLINNIETIMLDWLSVGLDPNKSTLFVQSLIPEHAELYLYLSMITPISWLERNPTYKDQILKIIKKDYLNYGFLGYPVIQAADILIYKAKMVPVGYDQIPHIEITREISRKFNSLYGKIFPEPNEIITTSPKILGINRKKMSKSLDNAIYISDTNKEILEKISKMITDPKRKRKTDKGTPSVCNVFNFHKLYSQSNLQKLIDLECRNAKIGCVECKSIMSNNMLKYLAPFRENRNKIKQKPKQLKEIIYHGSKKARIIAKKTMDEVREAMKIKI